MKKGYLLIFLIVFSFFTQTAFSQNKNRHGLIGGNYNSLSSLFFTVGTSQIAGTLRSVATKSVFDDIFDFNSVRYEVSLGFRHSFANRLGYRISLHHGLYKSIDATQRFPNTTSNITMFTTLGEFNIVQSFTATNPWRIYAYGGLGLAYAFINFDGAMVTEAGNVTFRTSEFAPIIPVGLGFDMWINSNFNIGLEVGLKYAFSDYMDGVRLAGSQSRLSSDVLLNVSLTFSYRLSGNMLRRNRCGC